MEEQNSSAPETLIEAIRYFADPDVCLSFLVSLRWPDGRVVCPYCGNRDVTFLSSYRRWKCRTKHPRQQFSVKVGTIFEDSPIPLDKWMAAMWMIANCKNGVSSYEIARALGVTQKTAWFMLHRIRLAMEDGSVENLRGRVEADETYIGGNVRNMHRRRCDAVMKGARGAGSGARPSSWGCWSAPALGEAAESGHRSSRKPAKKRSRESFVRTSRAALNC